MPDTFIKYLANKLIDWLFVLLGVSLVLWFGMSLPIFSVNNSNENLYTPIINQEYLKSHVRTLIEDYAPRTVEYGNLNITAQYIHFELAKFGETSYQPYWTLGGRYSNVALSLGPETKEVFVIGAHYDAESDSLDVDGNATGIATLIELARHLSENKNKLPIKVILVAYPLSQRNSVTVENMGSFNHAAFLKKQEKDVKLMISLDGVGRFNTVENSQHYPYRFLKFFYPNKGDYISLIGRLQDFTQVRRLKTSFNHSSSLPLYSFNAPQRYSPTSSYDHVNYQKQGFPAVLISDTADFRQLENINNTDIVEQLSYEKMAMLVKGLYQVVMDSEPRIREVQLVHQKGEMRSQSQYYNSYIDSHKSDKKGGGVL